MFAALRSKRVACCLGSFHLRRDETMVVNQGEHQGSLGSGEALFKGDEMPAAVMAKLRAPYEQRTRYGFCIHMLLLCTSSDDDRNHVP